MQPMPASLAGAVILSLAAAAAGAGEGAADKPDLSWGPARSGRQIAVRAPEKVPVGGKLVLELSLRNLGRAAGPLGAEDRVFGWLSIVVRGDRGPVGLLSQKVYPARGAKEPPAALARGRVLHLGPIDLSNSKAYPSRMAKQVLKSYVTGAGEEELKALDKRLADLLTPGTAVAQFTLLLPREDGRRPLALKSRRIKFEVIPAPPPTRPAKKDPEPKIDLSKLPEARRKDLLAELIARFDRSAAAGQAASRLAARYGAGAVAAMIEAVGDSKRPAHSRMWLTAALADIPDPRAAKALIGLLAGPGPEAHVAAYHGPKQRDAGLDGAIVAAAGRGGDHRLTALAILGFLVFRGQAPPKLLAKGLDSPDPRARAAVARAIGESASDRNVAGAVKLLRDKDVRVRAAAARTLGLMKRPLPAIFEALVRALDLPGESARPAICNALTALSGEKIPPYDPAADPKARDGIRRAWKTWWAKRGEAPRR